MSTEDIPGGGASPPSMAEQLKWSLSEIDRLRAAATGDME